MSINPKNYLTWFCLLLAGFCQSQTVSNINVQPAGGLCGLVDCNGQAAIYIDNGTPPFTISLSNGDSYSTSYNYLALDSLCAGLYSFTVTDNLGATYTDGFQVDLTSNVIIDSVETLKEIECYGALNGVIAVHASGGEGPYSYELPGVLIQSGNVFQNVPSGGQVIVSDQNGCADTSIFNVLEAFPFSFSTTTQNSCGGACTGSVSFAVSGGTQPYTYSSDNGLTFQTNNSFTGLCATNYTLVVKDANGCLSNTNVYLTGGPPLSMSPSVTQQPSCSGVADGSIAVNPSGGTPPYSSSIDGGPLQASMNYSNIPSGQHQIYLIDNNGCDLYMNITLTASSNFVFNYVANNPTSSCNAFDGSFEIAASGMVAPYIYTVDGWVSAQGVGMFSGLSAGIYTLMVMDGNGCVDSVYTTISDGPLTTQTDAALDPSCGGACDGVVQASPTSGLAPYSYFIDFDNTPYPTNTFTGLCGGQHFVGIQDNNNCLAYEEIDLAVIQPITFTTSTASPVCSNGTGQITINGVMGGDGGPYQYSIDNGATFQSGNVFSGLSPGTYTPVVQDGNGCQGTQSVSLLGPANPLGVTASSADVQCFGGNSGYIFISAYGGTSPYSYDLGGNVSSVGNYPNLVAGSYYFVVTDGNGCSVDTTILISQPSSAVQINSTAFTNPECNGNMDGSIEINASGGTPYLLYSPDNGTSLFSFDSIPFLGGGTHTVLVQDVHGCTQTSTVTLTDPLAVIIDTLNVVPEFCAGFCDGTVEVTVVNGTTPYFMSTNAGNFQWLTLNHFLLDSICSGPVNITAIDDSGCVNSFNFNMVSLTSLSIDTTNFIEADCYNDCDGIVDLTISGGSSPYVLTASSGYVNAISPGIFQLDSICSGSILVSATDNNGCSENATFVFTEPTALSMDTSNYVSPTCFKDCDGIVDISISGGNQPYSFTANSGHIVNMGSGQYQLDSICAGSIQLMVSDNSGCTEIQTIAFSDADSMYFSFNQLSVASCTACNDGVGEITVFGGTAPYSVDWSPFGSADIDTSCSDLMGGTGLLCVTDANGCQFCDSVTVNFIDDIGFEDFEQEYKVYPNPTEGELWLELPSIEGEMRLNVYSIDGKIVYTIIVNQTKQLIDLTELEGGMYVLELIQNDNKFRRELVLF